MNTKTHTILIVLILALCSSCRHPFMAKWPPAVDPLKGWNSWSEYDEQSHPAISGYHGTLLVEQAQAATHSPLDKAIKVDYENYLKKHRYVPVGIPTFYEDGTGQNAVRVETEGYNHDVIFYVFVYNKSHVRAKLLRYYFGHMSC